MSRRRRKDTLVASDPNPGRLASVKAVEHRYFSGPLPPPSTLAQYNDVVANGAERILAMAERQSAHREAIEAKVVDGNVLAQRLGSTYAFILSLVAILGGIFLIHEGRSVAGLTAILADLITLAGVFVYSRHAQRRERDEKANALTERRSR